MIMNLYEELKQRGVLYQISNEEAVKKLLNEKNVCFYIGFDPTAESLHVGNLLQIITMKRLQKGGLKPIILIGGATGLIGDPSGKFQERQLNPKEVVKKRSDLIKKQLDRFFESKKVIFVNNYDWMKNLNVLEFLRDIGKHFSLGAMLNKESVKNRLETGISYTEFSYMIFQAYDFLKLFEKYNCQLQIGGSDQWGNITSGIDLIRRLKIKEIYGFTIPLVVTSDGQKMGKTEKGTVWLDAKMTSPYHFYQFWINVDDKDVVRFLNYYTFLSLEKIKALAELVKKEPEKREAQKTLAKEMTIFVHGKAAFEKAKTISEKLFYGKISELNKKEVEEIFIDATFKQIPEFSKINIVDFLVATEVNVSKRQAREDIQNRAIEINGAKITDLNAIIVTKDLLFGKYFVIKRGKRDYRFVQVK